MVSAVGAGPPSLLDTTSYALADALSYPLNLDSLLMALLHSTELLPGASTSDSRGFKNFRNQHRTTKAGSSHRCQHGWRRIAISDLILITARQLHYFYQPSHRSVIFRRSQGHAVRQVMASLPR